MPQHSAGFVEAVLVVVADIPPGCVATYGDVAAILGSRGARAVGQVMAQVRLGCPVVARRPRRAVGRRAGTRRRLGRTTRREGTPLVATTDDDGYRIAIARCRWRP